MGSGQSARKLTISNEEEIGVIKVSNAIVQRLAQSERSGIGESSSDRSSTPLQRPPPPAATIAQTADTTSGQPAYYYPEITISALQMQQQKENELRQQEEYWQRRLQNLEDGYQNVTRVLENEYKKAISETSVPKAGQPADIQGIMQPCLESSSKLVKCYQDHPKQTLKCSNLVEEFSNCVWNVQYTRVIETRS
ncbi:MICOS complex subunit MIC25 [Linepithema humile]|uniref:MICOS complex subunit MIC25 n=1 Tax=Linepithema humile TaxID=83485 RepID=UPI00351F19FC